MSGLAPLLQRFLHRPSRNLARDIDDELMFHFRTLVEDNVNRGMSSDAAWSEAERRFGSVAAYGDECRRVDTALPRATLMLVAAVVLLTAVSGWLLREVRALHLERQRLIAAAAADPAEGPAPQRQVLQGRVLDDRGRPLAQSHVLVVIKTWPHGRFHQRAFATSSDARGDFALAYRIPSAGPYAVQVAAVKQGYAIASAYHLMPEAHDLLDAVELRMPTAAPLTLIVQDQHGRPIPGARVVPTCRQNAAGQSHLVYLQGSEPVQSSADGGGRVTLPYFLGGDRAEISVKIPGRDWEPHTIGIPPGQGEIVVRAETRAEL